MTKPYPNHPAADLFPRMTDAERQELKADIQENGCYEPIEIFDKQVIDGRHRYEICLELDIDPEFVVITEHCLGAHHCPYRYVASRHTRRNLTQSQKAMVGAKLRELKTCGAARSKVLLKAAAEATGASLRMVGAAARVKREATPEVVEAVERGEIDLTTAERLLKAVPDKGEQAKAMRAENPKEEAKRRISGGATFDVEEIEGSAAEPERKRKNGAPLVSTKDRKETVKAVDVLSRQLQKIGVYDEFIGSLSAIRERVASL